MEYLVKSEHSGMLDKYGFGNKKTVKKLQKKGEKCLTQKGNGVIIRKLTRERTAHEP